MQAQGLEAFADRILKLEDDRVKEPHPRTVRMLAQALGVDPAELIEN